MRLVTARRNRLLSQRDLAKKAGITASTIYLIENGRTTPRIDIMRKISTALNVEPQSIDEFRRSIEQG